MLKPGEVWEFTLKAGETFSQRVETEIDLELYDLYAAIWRAEGSVTESDVILEVGFGIEIDPEDSGAATLTISASQTVGLMSDGTCYLLEMYGRLKSDETQIMPLIDLGRFTVLPCSPELRGSLA